MFFSWQSIESVDLDVLGNESVTHPVDSLVKVVLTFAVNGQVVSTGTSTSGSQDISLDKEASKEIKESNINQEPKGSRLHGNLTVNSADFGSKSIETDVEAEDHLKDLQTCDSHGNDSGNSILKSFCGIISIHEGVNNIIHSNKPSAQRYVLRN